MTNSALKMLDATIHRQMAAVGLAEGPSQAHYVPADGGAPIPVRVYVDRSMQLAGEFAPSAGPRVVIGVLLSDVPNPHTGAQIVILAEGGPETFVLEAKDAVQDESISRWVVSDGQ